MEVKKHFASFAEAIREGAKLRPQAFGRLSRGNASCAMGAGLEAIEGALRPEHDLGYTDRLFTLYPYLRQHPKSAFPQRANYIGDSTILSVIAHLNDKCRWTREQVADWLYAEEEKLGFVTVIETEALKPQVGFINNAAEAQAGVLTKRF